MTRIVAQRHSARITCEELSRSLTYIIAFDNYRFFHGRDLTQYLSNTRFSSPQKRWVKVDNETGEILAIIFGSEDSQRPMAGVLLEPQQEPDELSISFLNAYCRVFNEDVRVASKLKSHSDLWQTLRQTQFRRSIAKFSAFSTSNVTRVIQLVENSVAFRYEGQSFNYRFFLTKQEKWLRDPLGENFIPFARRLPYEQALVSEHWIRAAVDGGDVGLVALGHNHGFIGMFNTPNEYESSRCWSFCPHNELVPLQNLLVNGTALFIVSEHSDVYILLPNGATFWRTQGRWRFLNYMQLQTAIGNSVAHNLAISVVQIALDLSYERHGALLVILDDASAVTDLVKDHNQAKRANKAVRDTVRGMNLSQSSHRKVVVAACKSDGALILSKTGEVLDVACMVGDPAPHFLQRMGIKEPQRFPGARSTAAWNASIFGTAIKVSEDGPITVYRHGRKISEVG